MSNAVAVVTHETTPFTDNADIILHKRYYERRDEYPVCEWCSNLEDENGNLPSHSVCHESVDQFFARISFGVQQYEDELFRPLVFMVNSPTLFNAGTVAGGTLSACFKFDVPDNMEGILDVAKKAGMVLKAGGGVGYVVSDVRPKGAHVNSTHRKALGPLGCLDIYQVVARQITQGGKRDGAQMGILHCDHEDINEFIHLKDDNPEDMETFNISVALTDEFMLKAVGDLEPQAALLQEMAESAWKTGDPGCFFIDTAERYNPTPWLGQLTGTNPCGEVPLLDNEACNLGSLNLAKFVVSSAGFDEIGLVRAVRLAVRYLDDVLDRNTFPDPLITEAVRLTRKIGLGVMGWADALALMGIPYDSEEAVELAGVVSYTINQAAHAESVLLGEERGNYPGWELGADWREENGIEFDDFLYGRRRNATVTCIAPTGTIAIIAGASGGVEPHFAIKWTRVTGDGIKMQEYIPVMEHLPDGFIPATAMEIAPEWHIRHQAAWQRNVDLACSKTINMPAEATVEDIRQAYTMMWNLECRGGTIYRNGSRDVQVLTVEEQNEGVTRDDLVRTFGKEAIAQADNILVVPGPAAKNGATPAPAARRKMPETRNSITHKFSVGDVEGYAHVGLHEDGTPGEVFLDISKQGSTIAGLADELAIFMSMGLQYGVPMEEFIRKMRQTRFEPSGLTGNVNIRTATSMIDYLGHWLEQTFLEGEVVDVTETGMTCPECGNGAIPQEGCLRCPTCGWSRC